MNSRAVSHKLEAAVMVEGIVVLYWLWSRVLVCGVLGNLRECKKYILADHRYVLEPKGCAKQSKDLCSASKLHPALQSTQ